ncbi:MAG: ankyrin repeat domain-containing protein [archaeon]|nr:ankyrin repeat domain-containing protein [archaeon]
MDALNDSFDSNPITTTNHNQGDASTQEQSRTQYIVQCLVEIFKSDSQNKVSQVQAQIDNQDIIEILSELSTQNLEDISVFILKEFQIVQESGGEDLFKSLFFQLITLGQIKTIKALVEYQKVDFSQLKDADGNSGLMLATIYSNIKIAKYFLKNYESMTDDKNALGFIPIQIAVYNNDNLMFFLLANNSQIPPLLSVDLCKLAIRNENLDILDYLHKKAMSITLELGEAKELLHYACAQRNIDIFEKILTMVNGDVNYLIEPVKESCLHWAVMRGSYSIVKRLIEIFKSQQKDIDIKNVNGVTPFFLSHLRQDKSICELLYESGAYSNVTDIEGNSIAHLVASLGDLKWFKYTLKKFNVNCYMKNNKGNTPFMLAVLNQKAAIVKYMIELFKTNQGTCSTNLNCRNNVGQTPLHAAVFVENTEILTMLLKNNADITICDMNDFSPYHYAYIGKKATIVECIHTVLNISNKDMEK